MKTITLWESSGRDKHSELIDIPIDNIAWYKDYHVYLKSGGVDNCTTKL